MSRRALIRVLSMLLAASPVAAQDRAEPRRAQAADHEFDKDAWPTELTRRPLTLAPGMFELTAPLNANLSAGSFGEPVFLNPSLYYGVTRDLSVGVRHFVGVCVTGKSRGCSRVYDDVSVDANWSFYRRGPLDAVAGAALNATSFDPFTLSAEARLGARWRSGVVAVTFIPQMNFGLSHRDTGPSFLSGGGGTGGGATTTLGNREVLTLPVTVQVQATRQLAVSAGVALSGPLDPPQGGFDDAYTVPVSAAVDYAISHALDVGAAFAFTNLGGRDGSWDDRFGKVYARVRW